MQNRYYGYWETIRFKRTTVLCYLSAQWFVFRVNFPVSCGRHSAAVVIIEIQQTQLTEGDVSKFAEKYTQHKITYVKGVFITFHTIPLHVEAARRAPRDFVFSFKVKCTEFHLLNTETVY